MKRTLFLTVGLVMILASLAQAAAEGGSKKGEWDFAAGAGYSKELNSGAPGGSIGAQGEGMYMLSPQVGIGPMAGYYVLGKTTVDNGDGTTTDYTYSVIPITGQVEYMFQTTGNTKPYVMGGAGVYMNRVSVSGASSSESKFGFNGGAGFEILKNSMGYGAEARFHVVSGSNGGDSGKLLSVLATVHFH
jgi:hypothetical protein